MSNLDNLESTAPDLHRVDPDQILAEAGRHRRTAYRRKKDLARLALQSALERGKRHRR